MDNSNIPELVYKLFEESGMIGYYMLYSNLNRHGRNQNDRNSGGDGGL